jgi:hypothetical protein
MCAAAAKELLPTGMRALVGGARAGARANTHARMHAPSRRLVGEIDACLATHACTTHVHGFNSMRVNSLAHRREPRVTRPAALFA